jgi:ribosomal protein L37AE/L43A
MPASNETTLPTVAQLKLDPDAATPDCPACHQPLGIREAWMNTSGIDEWECDNCGRHGVNEHGC